MTEYFEIPIHIGFITLFKNYDWKQQVIKFNDPGLGSHAEMRALLAEGGPTISKRAFLQAVAGSVAAMSLSAAHRAYAAKAYAADIYDIIVIGAGTAGMPLAITAAERGAKVLVIEKSGQIGGTLYLSGGHFAAAGSRLQKRLGIEDSPDQYLEDIVRLSNNKADPAITRPFVNNAGATLDWLEDLGFRTKEGDPIKGEAHADFSVRRYAQGPEYGRSILKALRPSFDKAVASGNVRALIWTGAAELVLAPDKSVTGVIAEDENGKRTQYSGRSVVIASGGMTANLKKFKEITGRNMYSRMTYGFSQGQGLDLGVAAGGVIRGAECQTLGSSVIMDRNYPSPPLPGSSTESARLYGATTGTDPRFRKIYEIQVNKLGQRFMAEDSLDVDAKQHAFTNQPTQRSWILFDQEIADKAPPLFKDYTPEQLVGMFDLHPMFFRAASLDELAYKIGLPPENLAATVAVYNKSVKSGKDEFGREFMPLPLARAPFYGVEMSASTVVGFAGLTVDGSMRVLDKNGAPIRNLYAAGEVIGHAATAGNTFVNGAAVGPALTFGRLLGTSILPIRST